jgi:hypothetical protein
MMTGNENLDLIISKGNSKIGAVPNISHTPGDSCRPGVPCLFDGCYAMKAYRMYPTVRKAWDQNLALWRANPTRFVTKILLYLQDNNPERFRYHVGGDIPDQDYVDMMVNVAANNEKTSFLAFTKKYELEFKDLPSNLTVVLSAWPGLEFPYAKANNMPSAWLSEDPRAPTGSTHIHCVNHCGDCDYKCWHALKGGMSVIFNKH